MVAELLDGRTAGARVGATLARIRDRALHAVHRRLAERTLTTLGRPRDVLVICQGNLCRSPFAAAVLVRTVASYGIGVYSAGLGGYVAPAPSSARAAARRRGLSLDTHWSQGMTAELASACDLFIVMDAHQQRVLHDCYGISRRRIVLLGDFDPAPVESRTILDPMEQAPEAFDACYIRIERCVAELATILSRVEIGPTRLAGRPRNMRRARSAAAYANAPRAARASATAGIQSSTHIAP